MIVSVRPATVIVPDRSPPPFGATVRATDASPVPDALPSESHCAAAFDAVAVHAQLACDAAIVTVPVPPLDGNDCADAFTVNERIPITEIADCVYRGVVARHGSISAEHGIGLQKREALHARLPAPVLTLMRQLKAMMDPDGVLNPGKVV